MMEAGIVFNVINALLHYHIILYSVLDRYSFHSTVTGREKQDLLMRSLKDQICEHDELAILLYMSTVK